MTPEIKARQLIDQKLEQAGWVIQDLKQLNLGAVSVAAPMLCIRLVTVEHKGNKEGTPAKMFVWSALRALFSKGHIVAKQTLNHLCDARNVRIATAW